MNRLFSKTVLSFMLFTFTVFLLSASSIPKEIITCFKTGNAKALNVYLNKSIELQVLEDENVYSKAQAEQILNNFFIQNKPVDFEIVHQSGKEGSEYAIGTLHTLNGKFRIYFLLKVQDQKSLIYQLSIKKENG